MFNKLTTWEKLNESEAGSYVLEGPDGKNQKITYKIQDNNSYLVKIKETANFVNNGQLNDYGKKELVNIHNAQEDLIRTFGKIDDSFFKEKLIIYVIKKDTDKTEKIQLKILNRNAAPSVTTGRNFVSAIALSNIQQGSELDSVIKDAVNKINTTDTPISPKDEVDAAAKPNAKLSEFGGRSFRYDMRTNNKRYLMTFTDDGYLEANVIDKSKPDGTVSLKDGKIMWDSEEDNNVSSSKWADLSNRSLYVDCEITNKIDKENLTKVLTDKEYADKILTEYEEKYGYSEVTVENIKGMLYNRDGSKMFPEEGENKSSGTGVESEKSDAAVLDTDINRGASNGIQSSNLGYSYTTA